MIQVAIVDDSAVVRQVLSQEFAQHDDIEVLCAVQNPVFAERRFQKCWPDVIVLDIEMPEKDGLTFLKEIMGSRPTPIIICSTLTVDKSRKAMEALALGAFDTVEKPKVDLKSGLLAEGSNIANLVRAAAKSNISARKPASVSKPVKSKVVRPLAPSKKSLSATKPSSVDIDFKSRNPSKNLIAIGSSTGGTLAIEKLLNELEPARMPGIVVTQHMPAGFTKAFAERLNRFTEFDVVEAENGMPIVCGAVYIAPGSMHLSIRKGVAGFQCEVKAGPPVNRHCPSVDVLFRSVATTAKSNVVGVILTGMGNDGAQGLLKVREAGAHTIAQDQESCVVFGMPKEAIKLNAAEEILHLQNIPEYLNNYFRFST